MSPQNEPRFARRIAIIAPGVLGVLALVGLFLFMRDNSQTTSVSSVAVAAPSAPFKSTSTPIPPTKTIQATPTPIVIMGMPNEVTPPPAYIVGPTAQFTKWTPLSAWRIYEDKETGFNVKYPPDWYLKTAPEKDRVAGSVTSLYSYDSQDMNLSVLGKSGKWPPNFVKLEIYFFLPEGTGHPLGPNQAIEDWVRASYPDSDEEKIVSETMTEIDGVKAFERVTQSDKAVTPWRRWRAIYLSVDRYIMIIGHPYEREESFNKKALEIIVSSIRWTK